MDFVISTGFADRLRIDAYEAIDIVALTPFRMIELWTVFYGKIKHFDWQDSKEISNLKKKLTEHNITVKSIHAPFSYDYEFNSDNDMYLKTVLDDTKNIILVSAELGADYVVVHPGSRPNTSRKHLTTREYKNKFKITKNSLEELAEFITKHNIKVKVALENQLPHIMFGYFDEIAELISFLNHFNIFGICFDSSHAMMAYDNNTETLIKNLEPYLELIITTHISDTDGVIDAHLVPGEGKIEWYKLTTGCFRKISRNVPLVLEILTCLKGKSIHDTINEAYKRMLLLEKEWW
ncbi:MAG: sugar phosphate isomerase/epimerase [Endomicrobia bacterium]|nr:sugar phosphate isomerase/epimerase [Endomicrobiia bacterium]